MKKTFTKKCLGFKRILFLLIVFGSINYNAYTQVINTYSFSQTTGTYTPITTGTVLGIATNDDTSFPANPIGFSFTYGGTTFTTFSVNSNGFLALGSTVSSSTSVISTGNNNVISALNADLQGLPTVGEMRFDTIGSAPNRTLVMQWKNYSMFNSANNTLDSFDFQIRLNETSNSIEIKYGRFIKASGGSTVQVGVKGSSNAIFLNRSSTSSWTTSTAGTANSSTLSLTNTVLPTNGLMFIYTPPPPAAPSVFTGTKINITTNAVTLAGSIAINQFPIITTSGIVLGTSANPLIGGSGVIDSTTNPLVTTGSFTKNIVGLANATLYYYRAYAINSVGTTYGADSTFTTNTTAAIPTVLRIAATNLTITTATVGGNITSDGGSTVTASGIVYSTTTNPLLFGTGVTDSTTNPLVTSGNYSFTTAGLTHSTKYYFKAYATNSVGTAYSSLDSFTTAPIVSVLPYFQNFDSVGTTGWSSLATGGLNEWVLGTPAKTQISGSFSSPKCWFTSTAINYSSNHNAAIVSPQFDFTSYSVNPVVRFRHNFRTEANFDAAVLEISINGGTWTKLDNTLGTGTNFNTANSLSWYNSSSTSGTVTPSKWSNNSNLFSTNVSNWIQSQTVLTGAAGQSNVKFRIRFASDGSGTQEGWAFDNVEVFPATAPTVVTGTKTNVTNSSAGLLGSITSNGNSTITKSGIVYSTSSAPVLGAFGVIDSTTNPIVTTGSFTKNIVGLANATLYYYRAYAINSVGTTYGADSTFTTNATAAIPTVLRIAASNITALTATFGGNITSDGGSTVTASGIVYSTTTNPLLFGTGVTDSTTNPLVTSGNYSFTTAGLTHSTKYYFKAYATNSVGTAYSSLDSFTTAPIVSVLPYFQNFDSVGNTGWTTASINARVNSWAVGTPNKTFINGAYSGANAYVTKLSGNYGSLGDEEAGLVSPQFDFTSSTSDPVLRFRNKHKTNLDPGFDCGVVEISINNGAWVRLNNQIGTGTNFNTLTSHAWCNLNNTSGFINSGNKFTNTTATYASQVNGWVESATRLTGAALQSNVKIRFHFAADAIGTDEGWAIDDIEVVNITAPSSTASSVAISSVTDTSATVTCTVGNGQRRLVVARLTSNAAVVPFDSVLYVANPIFGAGNTIGTGNFVVYNGTGNNVAVTGLTMLTSYTFDVYEFNGKYMHNSFASAATNSTTTLPVKLTYFEAKKANEDVKLIWITASEINNKGFEVQRSIDGKTFGTIAFVKGEGNSNNNVIYSSIDENAFAKNQVQKLYYRLNQIDFDGKSTLSPIKEVSINEAILNDIKIYPNPFTNEITIETLNAENALCNIQVVDISGRILINQTESVAKGLSTIKLSNTSNLSAGIYLVKISNNGTEKTMKIIKQ